MLRRAPRRPDDPVSAGTAAEPEAYALVPSRAYPKFLAALAGREKLTIIDLGPAIGSNIEYFAERAACKIFVEDLYADLERHARAGTRAELATALPARLRQEDASVDAVLCWDIFDFLEKPAAQAFARELVRVLKPGGALFGLFSNAAGEQSHYTKFVISDGSHFRHKTIPATPVPRQVLQNRDIIRMFDGLLVSDSYLLLTHTREIVFRKR
jgi:2-polyprenyl-3-methyl-5-hydroxy-6-metoxy-1,4-benzoquinol methylase